jgi:hypothetical protein
MSAMATPEHEHDCHLDTDAMSNYVLQSLGIDILNAMNDRGLLAVMISRGGSHFDLHDRDEIDCIFADDDGAGVTIAIIENPEDAEVVQGGE